MRLRIFKSVLLPAPFRPMIPTISPCLNLKGNIFESPEIRLLQLLLTAGPKPGDRCPHRTLNGVTQTFPVGSRVADRVTFAEIFNCNDRIGHGRKEQLAPSIHSNYVSEGLLGFSKIPDARANKKDHFNHCVSKP